MVHTSWKSIDAAWARCFMAPPSFMIRGRVACLLIYLTAWLISKTLSRGVSMLHTRRSAVNQGQRGWTGQQQEEGEVEREELPRRQSLIVLDLWASLIWPATRVDTSSSARARAPSLPPSVSLPCSLPSCCLFDK